MIQAKGSGMIDVLDRCFAAGAFNRSSFYSVRVTSSSAVFESSSSILEFLRMGLLRKSQETQEGAFVTKPGNGMREFFGYLL